MDNINVVDVYNMQCICCLYAEIKCEQYANRTHNPKVVI